MSALPKLIKDYNYYINLPWEFEFEKAEDGGYYSRVKNIPCHSYGENLQEATANIQEALELYIESSLEDNLPIDEPINMNDCTGKLNIRTKKSIHLKLLKTAQRENVSVSPVVFLLNQIYLVVVIIHVIVIVFYVAVYINHVDA